MQSSVVEWGGEKHDDDNSDSGDGQRHFTMDEATLQAAGSGAECDGTIDEAEYRTIDGVAICAQAGPPDRPVQPANRVDQCQKPTLRPFYPV